jgi:peptidoglycan/xylan/chitin deacetylase (PgdA/CDA1 family)
MRLSLYCFLLSFSFISTTFAEPPGPAKVAQIDTASWPENINTPNGFDKASRASELIYLQNLHLMSVMTDANILSAFKINSVNRSSVDKWLKAELQLTFNNYLLAAKNCETNDWTCLPNRNELTTLLSTVNAWSSAIPSLYSVWQKNIDAFTHTYIGEQIRLAALFPKVTSEIQLFNNNEFSGSDYADRLFFLTFDDGPTKAQSTTDQTMAMLKEQAKSGVFFVLGTNFQSRLSATSEAAVKSLYSNQCVALHGWEHQSHAKWDLWQDSILRTQSLVANVVDKKDALGLFRPPYGQRKDNSESFFHAQKLHVALWNIDSQDWNSHMDVNAVLNRVTTLMLIKRHGIILFHDIHPKAKSALPILFANTGNAVNWGDCHSLPPP